MTKPMIGVDPDFPHIAQIGAWWGPVPDEQHPGTRRTREGEIEVVGYDGTRLVLVSEATWSGARVDGDVLERLRSRTIHVPGYSARDTRVAIYARTGFTEQFRRATHEQGVILRTVDDLYSDR